MPRNTLQQLLCAIIISTTLPYAGSANPGSRCRTPNGEDAACVNLYLCPSIINAIASKDRKALEFAEQSHCHAEGRTSLVCCGSQSTFSEHVPSLGAHNSEQNYPTRNQNYPIPNQNVPKPSQNPNVDENKTNKKDLLASRQLCGFQSKDDRFESRNSTQIDEYPWMAIIFYETQKSTKPDHFCAGSLINNRYVLTAATCLKPPAAAKLTVKSVRLGEYDVSTSGVDCVENPDYQECTEPPIDFEIEEMIVHENYTRFTNDIGLIRLAKPVRYSDYIRPICLPFEEDTLNEFGNAMVTSGWGTTGFGGNKTNIKKNQKTEIENSSECMKAIHNLSTISDNEICVKHLVDGPCRGDNGGPMMSPKKFQWYQHGLVAFGTATCDAGSVTIGPRMSKYVGWILSKIRQ